ncbi:MAG: copper amine oxidase N-terminal domain-containing protein [Defluviitaleaceae bacterium]|nr:copper amine oxidase N-terminal domain-containing protein [Defluviitaleaceae bacterium]
MKKAIKGYVAGVITTVLLIVLATSVYAAARTQSITVTYNNIRLVVNGTHVIPRDAQGNVIEPFVFGGTTFLPVRAVAEALGQEVSWDGNTQTVYVGQTTQIPQPARFYLGSDVFATSQIWEEPERTGAFRDSQASGGFTTHPVDGSFVMNNVTYHRGMALGLTGLTGGSVTAYATAIYDTLGFTRLSGTFGFHMLNGSGTSHGTLIVTCADSGRFLGGADVSRTTGTGGHTDVPVLVDIDVTDVQRVQIRLQVRCSIVNGTHSAGVGFGDAFFQ